MNGLRSAPAIVIRVELEAAPRVLVAAARAEDYERLVVWLERRPELLELINRALELEAEAKAA